MSRKVEHVICLMMENRSFDHMLGFLEHPNPSFEGLLGKTLSDGGVAPTPNAAFSIPVGPDHAHLAVMQQLFDKQKPTKPYTRTSTGFVANYRATIGAGSTDPRMIMRCMHPQMVPVLATLAKEYAVCDHWFSSLPGGTFPNRDYAHAATSFGRGENPGHHESLLAGALGIARLRAKHGKADTIFQQLSRAKRSYRIYYHDAPALWLYPQFTGLSGKGRSLKFPKLLRDIANDNLSDYSFVEPDYGVSGGDFGKFGNSQHPTQAGRGEEFVAGEQLIASVYEALRAKPSVFEKTLFIITYDEHGGFYDHVLPPTAVSPGDEDLKQGGYTFHFDLLGARVPAVIVSPWIPRGTLDQNVHDHTSIMATVRQAFAPGASALTPRDASANALLDLLSLSTPRRGSELPAVRAIDINAELDAVQQANAGSLPPPETATPAPDSDLAKVLMLAAHAIEHELNGADPLAVDDAAVFPVPQLQPGESRRAFLAGLTARTETHATGLLELRDSAGHTLAQPGPQDVREAFERLRAQPGSGELRFSDAGGRVLRVAADGRLAFSDAGTSLKSAPRSPELALGDLEAFRQGDVQALTQRLSPNGEQAT